jgi:N-acetylmuramoyl-L-alanine amidase
LFRRILLVITLHDEALEAESDVRLFACLYLVLIFTVHGAAQGSPLICIDPGHPSEVGPGTKGKRISELHANWVVALKLKAELEARGIRTILTKDSEKQMVRNADRAGVANRAKADLMIRLHCDAAAGSGFMTVYPDRQGTVRGVKGPSKAVLQVSKVAASAFHRSAVSGLAGHLKDRGLHTDRHTAIGGRQGALTGSIHSKVPVVLIEMAVLTNAKDDAFMATDRGQTIVARAVADGVQAALRALGRGG